MLISEGPISKASCVQLPATKPCYVMVINRTVTKNALITSNNQCSMVVQEPMHGRRKDFSRGATRVFFQNFSRGPKVVKFVFSHSKSRKHRFFAEIFKIQRRSLAPLPPLFDAYELMFLSTHPAQKYISYMPRGPIPESAARPNKKCQTVHNWVEGYSLPTTTLG